MIEHLFSIISDCAAYTRSFPLSQIRSLHPVFKKWKQRSVHLPFTSCMSPNSWQKQLEKEKLYFTSWLQRTRSMVAWPRVVGQDTAVTGTCVLLGTLEAESGGLEMGQGGNSRKHTSQVTCFIQLPPTPVTTGNNVTTLRVNPVTKSDWLYYSPQDLSFPGNNINRYNLAWGF